MHTHISRTSALLIALSLSACMAGPDYHMPDITLPGHWLSTPAQDDKAAIEQSWWKNFHDPVLDKLIAKAATDNLDVQIAQARIAQARAASGSARADLLPTVNIEGSAERQANRIAFPGPINLSKPFNLFQSGFDATWEMDIFGGKRRALESAKAQFTAAEATAGDVRVSMLAEVARTYVTIRQIQQQINLVDDAITAAENTARITQERFESGTAAGVDVTRAKADTEQQKSRLPQLQSQLAVAEFSLDVLLGEQPGAAHPLVAAPAGIPAADKALVLAAPAAVIANRPDIRAAERTLAAATAQQGVAVARLFPDLSLSGFVGVLGTDSSHLLTMANKSWDVGGNVLWPILNYGKLSADIDASDARQQEAFLQYRKSVIVALSDVESAVTAYEKARDQRAALAGQVGDNLQAVDVAQQRYKEGMTSFVEVLTAQQALYTSQQSLADADAQVSQDVIAVYKSLGGGWS